MQNALIFIIVLALTPFAGGGGCETATGDSAAERRAGFLEALPPDVILTPRLPGDELLVEQLAAAAKGDGVEDRLNKLHDNAIRTIHVVQSGLGSVLASIRRVATSVPPDVETDERMVWVKDFNGEIRVLVVVRDELGFLRFQSMRRTKALAAPWRVTVNGTYAPDGQGGGQGSIWLALDVEDDDPATGGSITALWSRARGNENTVTVFFHAARLGPDRPERNSVYHHVKGPDGGVFVFDGLVDVDRKLGPAKEDGNLIARWKEGGSGRIDMWARGGDLPAAGFAVGVRSACWRARDFETVYDVTRVRRHGEELLEVIDENGDPSACLFHDTGTPVLPPLGAPPSAPEPLSLDRPGS